MSITLDLRRIAIALSGLVCGMGGALIFFR
jgi:ABC-type uncharacterized transport system permease subunit